MAGNVFWWKGALIAMLFSVVYSDFKHREVTLWQLLALMVVSFARAREKSAAILDSFSVNILFLLVQLAAVWLWFALKNRRWSGALSQYIGLGDGLFLLAVAPALPTQQFVLFYTSGLMVTLVFALSMKAFRPTAFATIPLAGCLAAWLVPWALLE